jgi:hypothetical protein
MTSPLRQVPAICPEEGVDLVPDLLRNLTLAQATGATSTIMLTKTITSRVQPPSKGYSPKHGYLYSEDNNDGHYHHPDKSNTVFATFSTLKAKKKRTQK